MLIHLLLIAHIVVLGYWLGSEFVINHNYRYVSRAAGMSFSERAELMEHVMDVDQHVRYALILQFALGFALTFLYGYLPGREAAATAVGIFGLLWLALVELTHRRRKTTLGKRLAALDRSLRYLVMVILVLMAVAAWAGWIALSGWLVLKLLCFAAVMACGVGIRFSLMRLGPAWAELKKSGSTPETEKQMWKIYTESTAILCGLWVFIAAVVWLSVWKP